MTAATITSKGQITIPKNIRTMLELQAGDKINFLIEESGRVSFVPMTRDITTLKGIVPRPESPVSIEDMKSVIKKRAVKS